MAFLIFLYSAGQRDWRGSLFGVAAVMFFGLTMASWNIESTYVFFNETSGKIVTYTYTDYSTATSYLCLGMGMLSIVLLFFKVIQSGLLGDMNES
jgi:hypothetical protein